MKLKILYLSPLIPSTSGSGGKRAIYNHLIELKQHGVECKLLMVDEDDIGASYPDEFQNFSPVVFPRALPRAGRGLLAKLAAMRQLLLDWRPRSAAVIASDAIRTELFRLIDTKEFEAVILDHLNTYAIVDGAALSVPLIYIAHNIESDVLKDRFSMLSSWSFEGLRTRLEYLKMLRFERRLLENAQHIILISSGDRNSAFLQNFQKKISVWPELPTVRNTCWQYKATKRMLFVGSARYFPNKDAILWLIEQLMPEIRRLDESITLTIAGTSRTDLNMADDIPGVTLAGFVNDEELERLHLESDLFICPVVLGSGIKIKVLEASSYGMPIMATKESLAGIDYLAKNIFELTRNPVKDAQNIIHYIKNVDNLVEASENSLCELKKAFNERNFLLNMLIAE